jgi:hypothetical protein
MIYNKTPIPNKHNCCKTPKSNDNTRTLEILEVEALETTIQNLRKIKQKQYYTKIHREIIPFTGKVSLSWGSHPLFGEMLPFLGRQSLLRGSNPLCGEAVPVAGKSSLRMKSKYFLYL